METLTLEPQVQALPSARDGVAWVLTQAGQAYLRRLWEEAERAAPPPARPAKESAPAPRVRFSLD